MRRASDEIASRPASCDTQNGWWSQMNMYTIPGISLELLPDLILKSQEELKVGAS